MRQPGEPSIEEILESIKQVIAREDRAGAFRGFRSLDPAPAEEEEDVFDLASTDQVPPPPSSAADALVAENASSAARGSLEALAGVVSSSGQPREPASESNPLEGLLRELLRPALADWLDRNLPAIVERMVAAEIARIAGRK